MFFTNVDYFKSTGFSRVNGDFYNDKIYAGTVVLNKNIAFENFGSYDIIGLPIELDKTIYKIIGITDDNTSSKNAYITLNAVYLKTIDEAIIREKSEQHATFLEQSKIFFSKEYLMYFLNFRIADAQKIFSIKELDQIYDIRLFYQSINLIFFLNISIIFFNIIVLVLIKQIIKLRCVFQKVMIFLKKSYIKELFKQSLCSSVLIETVKFLFVFMIFMLMGSKIIEFLIMYYNLIKNGYFLIFLRNNIPIIIKLSSFYVIQMFMLFISIYFTLRFLSFQKSIWDASKY